MPERIQLRRTAGWRMPIGTVKVDRTTRFGNPFRVEEHGRERALDLFAEILSQPERNYPSDALLLTALGGRDLACWCRLELPCHADLLLAHVEALGEGYDENPEGSA